LTTLRGAGCERVHWECHAPRPVRARAVSDAITTEISGNERSVNSRLLPEVHAKRRGVRATVDSTYVSLILGSAKEPGITAFVIFS